MAFDIVAKHWIGEIMAIKLKPGQTLANVKAGRDRMRKVLGVLKDATEPMGIDEIAQHASLSYAITRKALDRLVDAGDICCQPKSFGRIGPPKHHYLIRVVDQAALLTDAIGEYPLASSPFAVAAGLVLPPVGSMGRIFRTAWSDEEAFA